MSKKNYLGLNLMLMATALLSACGSGAKPTSATEAEIQLNTAAAPPDGSLIKVGLVTDTGGLNDQAFNQLAWEGIQRAAQDMGFQARFLESRQLNDYETNIDTLAAEGHNVMITVGSSMSDATTIKASQYPNIKFAIVDSAYAISGLANVTSLMFAEDQAGFLAGVLAGGLSRSGFACSVSSLKTQASERYMKSFFEGGIWGAGPDFQFMNNYINIQTTDANVPSFNDSTMGKETALSLISEGCDVVFAIGGNNVNGALLAARETNVMAIGADFDHYNSFPEAQSAVITSAIKNVDTAIYNYLRAVADGSVQAGISTGTLQNGGVGLASYHDWDSKIPDELKIQIQRAIDGINDGSIRIDIR